MEHFEGEGGRISYLDEGEGAPIVLIHGFASTAAVNWVHTGWVRKLVSDGRRVVALDNRGHGRSAKLYEPDLYRPQAMVADTIALLDHLGLPRADVMGYSMGSRVSSYLALQHPDRVRGLVLGGLGMGLVDGVGGSEPIARALEAESMDAVEGARPRMFRAFAEQTGSDLKALAACMRGSRASLTREEVARIAAPTLIAVGTRDDIAGSAHELAALMPDARALDIPERDHMLAVGDKTYKAGVLAFLGGLDSGRA